MSVPQSNKTESMENEVREFIQKNAVAVAILARRMNETPYNSIETAQYFLDAVYRSCQRYDPKSAEKYYPYYMWSIGPMPEPELRLELRKKEKIDPAREYIWEITPRMDLKKYLTIMELLKVYHYVKAQERGLSVNNFKAEWIAVLKKLAYNKRIGWWSSVKNTKQDKTEGMEPAEEEEAIHRFASCYRIPKSMLRNAATWRMGVKTKYSGHVDELRQALGQKPKTKGK